MAAVGDNDQNFYLWGAMGGAAMIGLGLTLAQPKNESQDRRAYPIPSQYKTVELSFAPIEISSTRLGRRWRNRLG